MKTLACDRITLAELHVGVGDCSRLQLLYICVCM